MTDIDKIKKVLETSGYRYRSYYRRYMFGKECISFTTGDTETEVSYKIAKASMELHTLNVLTDQDLQFIDELMVTGMASDNMGKTDMVYYFPDIIWEGEEFLEEDGD